MTELGRIAIITDDPGWHGKRLREALAARGYASQYVSLTGCRLELDGAVPPVYLPDFAGCLPHGVFVRGLPGGTLEEVTFRLDILHALQLLGVTVYNDGRAIERTVDKAMTSFLLRRAGISTPATWVTSDPDLARSIAVRELKSGHRLVSKPLFGSQGKGLRRFDQLDALDELQADRGVFYLQRYVDCGESNHDFRIFVIRGHAVAAMRRSGVTWLNNVHQGARCETVPLNDRLLCRLAEDAVRVVGMDYAGVDIMRDVRGRYSVLEINSIPAWRALQGVDRKSVV